MTLTTTNADCSRIKLEIALVFATILSFVGFGATTVTMTPGDNLAKLAEVGDDTTVVFPAGDYFLKGEVGVYTKKNLTLRGEKGARLVRSFDPSEPEKKVVLIFGWCENLTVEGFTVTTDNPVNTCGTVVSKTTKSFVVDTDGDGFLDGDELLRGTNPLDAQSHLPYPTVIILR